MILPFLEIFFFWSKGIFLWTGQGDQNISTCMLNLPFFILFHENWAYILGISKKNHQFSLVFAKNLWSWTLDPIPYEKKKKINFGLRAISLVLGWIFDRTQFWGVPWHVGSLEKPTFSWSKGPPLQENSPSEGTLLVDPERVHWTRSGSDWYLKG